MAKRKGNSGNNKLTGTNGDDQISGKGGNDKLYGKNGNDTLKGGSENDKLYGDKGNDDLFGGSGRDKFFFGLDSGKDFIRDFDINDDKIYISKAYGFTDAQEVVDFYTHSSGGDTAIDLSKTGDDNHQVIILGLDNANDLASHIFFF